MPKPEEDFSHHYATEAEMRATTEVSNQLATTCTNMIDPYLSDC